jgi:hypothetical protein
MQATIPLGTPRARQRVELAAYLEPWLEEFMTQHGATRPQLWATVLPLVTWCIADGAADAVLLTLRERGGTGTRAALIEVMSGVAPRSAPTSAAPPPLMAPSMQLSIRQTPAWTAAHDALFADAAQVVRVLPSIDPQPARIAGVRSNLDLHLVRRVEYQQ